MEHTIKQNSFSISINEIELDLISINEIEMEVAIPVNIPLK